MANINTQTTINTAGRLGGGSTYYDKAILDTAETQFVYLKHGRPHPIPKNSGKKIEMRRWSLWDPTLAATPLTEGETPSGLALEQDIIEAEVKQYGAYFTYSDVLNLTSYNEVLNSGADRLGEMLGTVLEWITRDELTTGNNVNWAGAATSRNSITADDKLSSAEIRKAVRDLKKRKARMFDRGGHKHFVAVVSPDAVYDLQSDPLWQAANTYVNQEALYSGELGRLFGVVFVESTESPVIINSVDAKVSSYNAASKTVTIDDDISVKALAYLESEGAEVIVGGEIASVASVNAENREIILSASLSAAPAVGTRVLSRDGADKGLPVHQTLIIGKDAYGTITIGSESIKAIIKGVGEGGFDPLNQRGTVGGKVMAYAAKILNEDWIVRIEHAVTED